MTPSVPQQGGRVFSSGHRHARRQRAKPLKLRAVMSLSRLWQQQGKREKARRTVTEVYGWLAGGFNAAGLQEARTLPGE